MSSHDCSFCNIVSDGLPPHGLFESDTSFVILDRKPLRFGHCMIVPKRHVVKLYELTPHEHANVLALTQRFARALQIVFADCCQASGTKSEANAA